MFQLVLYMFQFAGIVPRKREGKTTLYSTKHLDAAMKFIPKQLTDGLITLKDAVSKYNFLIPNLRYLIIRLGIQSEKIRGKIMFREADFKKSSPWLKSPDNHSKTDFFLFTTILSKTCNPQKRHHETSESDSAQPPDLRRASYPVPRLLSGSTCP